MDQVGITTSKSESFVQFLTVFLVFLLVLGLTYFTTRFVGSFQKNIAVNRNFEAIESYRITNGKYLQLVRIGNRFFAISVSRDNINTICELSEEDIKPVGDRPQATDSFKAIMEKAKERIGKGGNKNE